jgi:uncharacterized protein YndB with AHSA1/START domain
MSNARFVYVTFIRTTTEKLWEALTQPESTRQYWFGSWQDCAWTEGATWRLMAGDDLVVDAGTVAEIDRPRKLVLSWRHEWHKEMHEEGFSRATFTLEPVGETVKLTVIHEIDRPESKLIEAVSSGWPTVLSSLKSLLETGESFERTRVWPGGK